MYESNNPCATTLSEPIIIQQKKACLVEKNKVSAGYTDYMYEVISVSHLTKVCIVSVCSMTWQPCAQETMGEKPLLPLPRQHLNQWLYVWQNT